MALVTAIGVVGRALGFLSTMVIAARFGAGGVTDAYYTALILPSAVVGIIGGVTKVVYIPVFVRERIRAPDQTSIILGSAMTWTFFVSVAAVVLAVIASGTGLFVPPASGATAALRRDSLLILLAWIPVSALSGILTSTYNSYQRFGLVEMAVSLRHCVVIVMLLVLSDRVGGRVLALSFFCSQLFVLAVAAVAVYGRLHIRPCVTMSFHKCLAPVLGMSVLTVVSGCLTSLVPVVSRCVAARLGEGCISIFSYADKLVSVPTIFLGTGFVGVVMAHWSKMAADETSGDLEISFGRVVSFVLALFVPLALILSVLNKSLVVVLLRRGAFDMDAAVLTAQTFAVLILSVVPVYLHRVVIRGALAKQSVSLLVVIAATVLAVHCILTWVLSISLGMGVTGIALSLVISSAVGAVQGALIVHRRFVRFLSRAFLSDVMRVLVACTGAVLLDRFLGLPRIAADGLVSSLLLLGARFAAMAGCYMVLLLLLGHGSAELLKRKALSILVKFRGR